VAAITGLLGTATAESCSWAKRDDLTMKLSGSAAKRLKTKGGAVQLVRDRRPCHWSNATAIRIRAADDHLQVEVVDLQQVAAVVQRSDDERARGGPVGAALGAEQARRRR
jgi:hypothetical protein